MSTTSREIVANLLPEGGLALDYAWAWLNGPWHCIRSKYPPHTFHTSSEYEVYLLPTRPLTFISIKCHPVSNSRLRKPHSSQHRTRPDFTFWEPNALPNAHNKSIGFASNTERENRRRLRLHVFRLPGTRRRPRDSLVLWRPPEPQIICRIRVRESVSSRVDR